MRASLLALSFLLAPGLNVLAFQGGGQISEAARESRIRELIAEFAPKIVEFDKNPNTQAVLKKLDEPLKLPFSEDTPYEDVLKYIRSSTQGGKDSGVPVYLDPTAIADAGIEPSSTVRIDLEGIPLKTTLRLLLKQLRLAYCVKDGMIFISTPAGVLAELREFETEHLPTDKRFLTLPENQIVPVRAGGFQ